MRRAGGMMAGIGILAVLAGVVLYVIGSPQRAVEIGVGGLIVGLAGSMLLLVAADRLPPDDPGRP